MTRFPLRTGHFALLLLAAHLAIGLLALPHTAVTVDEFLDVPVGYLTWKTGDPRLDPQNAPLFRTLAFGAPLSLLEPVASLGAPWERGSAWAASYQFMVDNYEPYLGLFFLPRLAVILCGALLGWLVWLEARRRYSGVGGLAALALYAFCPNILAHSRLATLDLGLSLAFFATVAAFCRMRRRDGWTWTVLLGLLLGLAQVTKFTALLLYPLLLALALPTLDGDLARARRFRRLLAAFVLSVAVIDVGYFLHRIGEPLGAHGFQSPALVALAGIASGLPSPLPFYYLKGLDRQLIDDGGYVYYLLGELSKEGWWYYFLVAAAVKLTLPALGLTMAGPGRAIAARDREGLLHLGAPALAIFALFSFVSHKNIGFRYVLPGLPFLYVLAGGLFQDALLRWRTEAAGGAWTRARAALVAGAVLVGTHALEAVVAFPDHLAWFNQIAGGARGGVRWLGDSNLDWGQDLPALARFQRERGIDTLQLAYFGRVDPALYGIRYRLLRDRADPGMLAVSASFLQGLPYVALEEGAVVRTASGYRLREEALVRVPPGFFGWLLERQPTALLGGSIYVFEVPAGGARPVGGATGTDRVGAEPP